LPGGRGGGGRGGRRGGGGAPGGEMTQALYAHMNNKRKMKKNPKNEATCLHQKSTIL
jgi:hypothetical protein